MFVHKNSMPIPAGHATGSRVLRQREGHLYRLLGWSLIVRSALSSINRTVFRQISSAGAFAKRWKSAVLAPRDRLLSCNSETVYAQYPIMTLRLPSNAQCAVLV